MSEDRLYDKYTVTCNDGKPADGRRYFVLSPDTDPAARAALAAYADAVAPAQPHLAADMRREYDLRPGVRCLICGAHHDGTFPYRPEPGKFGGRTTASDRHADH